MSVSNNQDAFAYCQSMAKNHYENFPVASVFLPRRLRRPIAVIYAFARTADDIADEGELSPDERLAGLDAMAANLDALAANQPVADPVFQALAAVIAEHQLPLSLFYDLLSAFRQDVTKTRYAHFGEVMDYCRRSANPVGRLLLHLEGRTEEVNLGYSDAVCSSLQLINFLQDLDQDFTENNRIYLPQDEMERFGVTETHFQDRISDGAMQRLVLHQIDRAERILRAGSPLGKVLTGRLGFEIRMTILGGSRILTALRGQHGDLFSRPRLNRSDWLWMFWHALRKR